MSTITSEQINGARMDASATRSAVARRRSSQPTATTGLAIAVLGSLAILALVQVAALGLIRHAAEREALEQAGQITQDVSELALARYLTPPLLAGDPDAFAKLDAAGDALVAGGSVDHIKIWNTDRVVVWSDETELIGHRYDLEPDELALFESLDTTAEVSNLNDPENQPEAAAGADRLLEVYYGTDTAAGVPMLVETYSAYDLVEQRAARLRATFVPPMLIVLALLASGQVILVWLLSRRLARSERRRAELLSRVIEVSDIERRRVAAEVHDGVVQDLMGVSFALAGVAASPDVDRDELQALAGSTRRAVGSLRGLVSSIYPVDVPPGGWVAGLADVVNPLTERDVEVDVRVTGDDLSEVEEVVVLRIAREALRNVARHAGASAVRVDLDVTRERLALAVRDDGVGFDVDRRPDGHLGLRLLDDLARDAGGVLRVTSRPGDGTAVEFDVRRTR